MNIAENLNRIKSATDEIKSIADACLDTETDKVEVYPNRIAKAIVDTPTEQSYNGTRTLSGIKDGVAYMDKVKGKSIVWNQLLNKTKLSGIKNCSLTITNDTYRITLTSNATINYHGYLVLSDFSYLANHAYIIMADVNCDRDGTFRFDFNGASATQIKNIEKLKVKRLVCKMSCSSSVTKNLSIYPSELTDGYLQGEGYSIKNFMIFDLTQIFGSGNEPSSPDEFAQRLGYASIDDLPYFEYDEGSLLSFNAQSIQSKDADNNVLDTHSFNIADIKDSNGETLFPYGLLSADDVYDEINGDKAIKRIGVVDLGSLKWNKIKNDACLYFAELKPYGSPVTGSRFSVVTTRYSITNKTYQNMDDMCICPYSSLNYNMSRLAIRDDKYTDGTSLKSSLTGVLLYFELATPIEVNLTPYKQYYKVQNGGTETLVAEGNTTPLIADIGYRSAMSAEELVNTLNDTLNN